MESPAKVLLVFTLLFHVHMNDSALTPDLKYYIESDVDKPAAETELINPSNHYFFFLQNNFEFNRLINKISLAFVL